MSSRRSLLEKHNFRFGEIMKIYRKRAKLTQAELAKIIGVSDATIANYENGKTIPDIKTALAIGYALGFPDMIYLAEPTKTSRLPLYIIDGNDEKEYEVAADIFDFYNCDKFNFACISVENEVYFLTNSDEVIAGDTVLAKFSENDQYLFAEFDGKEYTDIKNGRRAINGVKVFARVLGKPEKFEIFEKVDYKLENPLIL